MEHTARDGASKILKSCSLPITGKCVVDMIITDLCVFSVAEGGGLSLIELFEGHSVEEVVAKTGCSFKIAL